MTRRVGGLLGLAAVLLLWSLSHAEGVRSGSSALLVLKWLSRFQESIFFRDRFEESLRQVAGPLRDLMVHSVAPAAHPNPALPASSLGSRLTFPHIASGESGGLAFQTNVILMNNSATDAHGTIFFRRTSGDPLTVKSNRGEGSQFNFSLVAGENYRLETDGTGPLTTGWIEVRSDIAISGSSTFALFAKAGGAQSAALKGQFLSEVGVADSPVSNRVMIFVDGKEGKGTGFAVCNPSAADTAALTYRLKRTDGTEVVSKQENLGPLRQKSLFVSELFNTQDLSNFQGSLEIASTGAPISVLTLRTRGVRFTSFPSAPSVTQTGAQTFYFPRLADGVFGGLLFDTSFVFMNNSEQAATVTLELFSSDGKPLQLTLGAETRQRFTLDIPKGGARELKSNGRSNPAALGWAKVTSTVPITGGAAFSMTDQASGQFVSEVGVPSSQSSLPATIFAQVSGDINTGIGLTNTENTQVSVKLRLVGGSSAQAASTQAWDTQSAAPAAAELLAEKTLVLEKNSHTGLFLTEFFPDVPAVAQRDFEGRVEVEFSGVVLTLRTRGPFLTSVPAAPFRPAPFAPKLTLQFATLLEGSRPGLCLVVRQNGEELGLRKAVIRLDKVGFDFARLGSATQVTGHLLIETVFGLVFGTPTWATAGPAGQLRFYNMMTTNAGETENVPFMGTVRAVQNGGTEIEVITNEGGIDPLLANLTDNLCFEAELFNLPPGGGPISVSESYESVNRTIGQSDGLFRTVRSQLQTTSAAAGSPRIEAVTQSRLVGGDALEIRGKNFSPVAAQNRLSLTSSGKEILLTVTEATATTLKTRIPLDTSTLAGTRAQLINAVQGKSSNPYQVQIIFSPVAALARGTAGAQPSPAATPLRFRFTQKSGEFPFMGFSLQPQSSNWVTAGFTAGQTVGRFFLERLSSSGSVVESEQHTLKVTSSDADRLAVDVVNQSGTVTYKLESRRSTRTLKLSPQEVDLASTLSFPLAVRLELESPLFEGGAGVSFNVEILSVPQRTQVVESAFVSRQTVVLP